MSTSTEITTLVSGNERARMMRVVHDAADAAFRARVRNALTRRINEHGLADLARSKRAAGISLPRWDALCTSTREAESPAEFQTFARVLRVSARWLAIGSCEADGYEPPPAGWEVFGTHVEQPGVLLEFSSRVDADGFPKWERAVR